MKKKINFKGICKKVIAVTKAVVKEVKSFCKVMLTALTFDVCVGTILFA